MAQPHNAASSGALFEVEFIAIHVQTLSGPLPPIIMPALATVRELKLNLQTLDADFGLDRQKLLISGPSGDNGAGVELLNHRTLQSYQITTDTKVMLVMLPRPEVVVCLDAALKDTNSLMELQANRDLRAISIKVDSICSHRELLLQLFDSNRTIQSVSISGYCWTEEHLKFSESLSMLRPDVDIRFQVFEKTDLEMMLRVANLSGSNHHSSNDLSSTSAPPTISISWVHTFESRCLFAGNAFCVLLAPTLEAMSSLKVLDLSFNKIKVIGCKSLASALMTMSSLQSLYLSNNAIGDIGCKWLASSLKTMTTLQHLNLSNNKIGDEGCVSLIPVLQSNSSLQTLRLCENKIGYSGCVSLASALWSLPSLRTLSLSLNHVEDYGSALLADALESTSELEWLDLSLTNNKIGVASIESLARALRSMPSLQTLVLRAKIIGAAGCVSLAAALPAMSSLHSLYLIRCKIEQASCEVLANALPLVSSLRTLFLSSNSIGNAGCASLVPALRLMPWLQTLGLVANGIRDEGCISLASALPSMSGLQKLDLKFNKFDVHAYAAGRKSLESAIQLMNSEKKLEVIW